MEQKREKERLRKAKQRLAKKSVKPIVTAEEKKLKKAEQRLAKKPMKPIVTAEEKKLKKAEQRKAKRPPKVTVPLGEKRKTNQLKKAEQRLDKKPVKPMKPKKEEKPLTLEQKREKECFQKLADELPSIEDSGIPGVIRLSAPRAKLLGTKPGYFSSETSLMFSQMLHAIKKQREKPQTFPPNYDFKQPFSPVKGCNFQNYCLHSFKGDYCERKCDQKFCKEHSPRDFIDNCFHLIKEEEGDNYFCINCGLVEEGCSMPPPRKPEKLKKGERKEGDPDYSSIQTNRKSAFTANHNLKDWVRCGQILSRMAVNENNNMKERLFYLWKKFSLKMCGENYSHDCVREMWNKGCVSTASLPPYSFGGKIWMDDGYLLHKLSDGCPSLHNLWLNFTKKQDSTFSLRFSIEMWENYSTPTWSKKKLIYLRYFRNEEISHHFFSNGFTLAVDDNYNFTAYTKEYKKGTIEKYIKANRRVLKPLKSIVSTNFENEKESELNEEIIRINGIRKEKKIELYNFNITMVDERLKRDYIKQLKRA